MTEPVHSRQADTIGPRTVLDFWLYQPPEHWFKPDPAFDRKITDRFGDALEQAKRGRYDGWAETAEGILALIILLDQFSRNIHRGAPEMYGADAKALALAKRAVAEGKDMALPAAQRSWIYLPFMHSEDLDDQEACIRLSDHSGLDESRHWAEIHADIIRRFGRFPHRNPILGRPTTEDEQRFLEDDDSFKG